MFPQGGKLGASTVHEVDRKIAFNTRELTFQQGGVVARDHLNVTEHGGPTRGTDAFVYALVLLASGSVATRVPVQAGAPVDVLIVPPAAREPVRTVVHVEADAIDARRCR
jgi:hypothetical protein